MGNKNKPQKTKSARMKQLKNQALLMRGKTKTKEASQSLEQRPMEWPLFLKLDSKMPCSSTEKNDERHRKIIKAKRQSQNTLNKPSLTDEDPTLTYEVENHVKVIDNEEEISGHRIIDIRYFFQELINISGHDSLFNCTLNSMKIKSEKQSGLSSEFKLICEMCQKEFKIKNSNENINKNAVAGAMAAGCGHAQFKQFSAALDIPILSEYKYKVAQEEVCDEWEVTAWDVMIRAGEKEREAALKERRVDKNGIPMIDVIVDGSWCKRSYRTNYSALSGTAAIIGRKFGQVLFYAVKNKYCCICAWAEKRKHTPKQHECYRNFTESSTSMESTIIAEGFKQSIDMHGLIYARFIADGDSSTYAKIIETRPYTSVTVEKIGCKNHILRNFCTKLQLLKTDLKYNKQDRQLLTNTKILCSRKYICDAIKYYTSCNDSKSDSIKSLHQELAIGNAIFHAFGCHDECNKNICSDKTQTPDIKKILNTPFFHRLRFLVGNVASQARSLIENVDSNIVESFNGVIAKLIGGKRINYATKRSYQARCAGAVISFNSGKMLTTVQNNIHHNSPPKKIKKYEEDIIKKREYNRTQKRKRNRKFIRKKIDFDYGDTVTKPDMDSNSFELAKATFLKGLEKTEEERHEIEQRTILQSDSGEWLELRRNMLTASNFGKIVKRKVNNTCVNVVKNMLYKPNIEHVASINHGKKNERIALQQLAEEINQEIKQCGIYIDEKYPFLGATPDGIANDGTLIEVKCPIAPFKIGIDAAIREGKMHFWKINKKTGETYVNKKSDWYMQVQGQMHICKKDKTLLAIWYGDNKIKTTIITRDDEFWYQVMEPKLLSFYYDCLLPELVDPRYTRNMQIRDPIYVLKKTEGGRGAEDEDKENEEILDNGELMGEDDDNGKLLKQNDEIMLDFSDF